ncbi:hypothetical protein [Streptomyces sp. NPDC004658]|uniref:beta family protein n=1 Tax=Streptomyces sp. NPDC004658 TaxID=3154672 RepID=UPI0033BDF679
MAVDCEPLRRFLRAHRPGDAAPGPDPLLTVAAVCAAPEAPYVVPVLHPRAPKPVLSAAAQVAARHLHGVLVRLAIGPRGLDRRATERALSGQLHTVGVPFRAADLVLDAGYVPDGGSVSALLAVVDRALTWLTDLPWRSVTLAAGSFPESVRGLRGPQPWAVPRWEVALWRTVCLPRPEAHVGFGDYGITHPHREGAPSGVPGRPHPHLRYTAGDDWRVWRYPRQKDDDTAFLDICRDVVRSPHWPVTGAATSWGDLQLRRRSDGVTNRPGNATKWLAWGTSHHVETVVRHLSDAEAR